MRKITARVTINLLRTDHSIIFCSMVSPLDCGLLLGTFFRDELHSTFRTVTRLLAYYFRMHRARVQLPSLRWHGLWPNRLLRFVHRFHFFHVMTLIIHGI